MKNNIASSVIYTPPYPNAGAQNPTIQRLESKTEACYHPDNRVGARGR